jgi:hypothetical protein
VDNNASGFHGVLQGHRHLRLEWKDETQLKSGDKVTFDPHAYTMVFKKIAGQWKVIYQQDSGTPVIQKAGKS